MFDFHQKRKLRDFWGSRVTQAILFVIAFFLIMSAYNRYMIARDMADRRETAEVEVRALEKRRESLSEEVKYLSNERGQEAEMRRQFDIARDGEQVVIILDEENGTTADSEEVKPDELPKRAWYRFW